MSLDSAGLQANQASEWPSLAANGQFVAFESDATNLVAGDTNFVTDVFLRDRGCSAWRAYCTAGTTTHGCVASMSASGVPSASAAGGFTLAADNVEGQRSSLLFYGVSGAVAVAWGTGGTSFLCVKSPTQRTPVQNSGGTLNLCDGQIALDFLAFLAANPLALGQPIYPGRAFRAQAWFRDPTAFRTTSLSDGLEFSLCP